VCKVFFWKKNQKYSAIKYHKMSFQFWFSSYLYVCPKTLLSSYCVLWRHICVQFESCNFYKYYKKTKDFNSQTEDEPSTKFNISTTFLNNKNVSWQFIAFFISNKKKIIARLKRDQEKKKMKPNLISDTI
jgi:hypothetical protein